MNDPIYLGDGVYAGNDGYHVILTTGNHDPAVADTVLFLDPTVIEALQAYIKKLAGV